MKNNVQNRFYIRSKGSALSELPGGIAIIAIRAPRWLPALGCSSTGFTC